MRHSETNSLLAYGLDADTARPVAGRTPARQRNKLRVVDAVSAAERLLNQHVEWNGLAACFWLVSLRRGPRTDRVWNVPVRPTLVLRSVRSAIGLGLGIERLADRCAFLKLNCDERGCDCRGVTVALFAERPGEAVAYISLGFDSADEMVDPFLDGLHPQASYAPELLRIFTDMINSDPDHLARLQRHYVRRRPIANRPRR